MTKATFVFYYETPIGKLGIAANGDAVTDLFFARFDRLPDVASKETPLIRKTHQQLKQYFAGKRTEFDVPLAPCGTEFQQAVWDALQTIPFGETRTYCQIAKQIKNPNASRAVGMANNRNPIAVIIPCHRVIGTNGKLVGYAGGLDIKQQLLDIETPR